MAQSKLYIGNLAWEVTSGDLEDLFSAHGTVVSAVVIADRMSGKSRGFGFVEFETKEAAQAAIDELNDKDLKGRSIRVDFAQEKPKNDFGSDRR
jgi:RNA recognition motif-containing protein